MNRHSASLTTFFFSAALAWCAPVAAQQAPAEAPSEQPAVAAPELPAAQPPASGAKGAKGPRIGTDIVGERESPIGLFITPWKDSGAETELERPARLLQEDLQPIDEAVFIRNLEYYEALTGALKGKKVVTPLTPPGTPATPSAGTTPTPPTVQP